MAGDPSASEELETLWKPRGLRVSDLTFASDGTLAASERRASSASRARAAMPARPTHAPDEHEIAPGEEIGRGGMGVVHAATQRTLQREVAVKRALDPELKSADLFAEGWALGHLAHPSVVPVHAIAYLDGVPALVMKRVSGTPWADVLAHPAERATLIGDDLLGFHLATLIEVARSIEHAHARGVLHLDLKPQNVMIGEFGEVYVLDWGLAARIGDQPEWLAAASSIDAVAGTPEYMAPELAMAAGARIGVHTDVYLLGAILHEIVTGRVRHVGANPIQRLYRACVSAPAEYGPEVPRELAVVAARATALEPADRHPTAEAFRRAVEEYLEHREADALFARAEREADALEAALHTKSIDRAAVHAHFGGGRFAAREARTLRPDAPGADALARRLHGSMARFALDAGEVALAEAHLREVPGGMPELEQRIADARSKNAAHAAYVRRLEVLANDEDLSTEHGLRSAVALVLAVAFLVSNLAMGLLERSGVHEFGYADTLGVAGALVVFVGPWAWLRRRKLFPNRAGGGIWAICLAMLAVTQGHWVMCIVLEIPFHSALALTPVLYMLCFGALATLLDPRLWLASVLQVPTALLAAALPEYLYEIIGVGGAASVGFLAARWAQRVAPRAPGRSIAPGARA